MKQSEFYIVREAGAKLTDGVEPSAMQHYEASEAGAAKESLSLSLRGKRQSASLYRTV